MTVRACAILLALLPSACGPFPADQRSSLESARADGLRVGVANAAGWSVWDGETAAGADADLVRAMAQREGLEIEWIAGDSESLLRALEAAELHIVIAGLIQNSPWSSKVTMSEVYSVCDVVIGLPPAAAVTDPDELQVRIPSGFAHAAKLRQRGVVPVEVARLDDGDRPAAGPAPLIAALGLMPWGDPLTTERHVVAIPHGENALHAALTRAIPEDRSCRMAPRTEGSRG